MNSDRPDRRSRVDPWITVAVSLFLLVLLALPSDAQVRRQRAFPTPTSEVVLEPVAQEYHAPSRLPSSALAALAGGVAFGFGGYHFDRALDLSGGDDPGLGGFTVGMLVGTAFGSALGAHLASEEDTSLAKLLVYTSVIGAVGAGVGYGLGGRNGGGVVILATPVAQVLAVGIPLLGR